VNLNGLRDAFTVITVELLGHGASDAPEDAIFYRPERAIRRILQLLDQLGHQRVLLCGHSLGGALALRLALDAPEWVAGLVVINSSSAAGDPEWRDAARPRMEEMGARVRAEGTEFMKKTRLYPAHSRRLDPLSRQLLTDAFDRLQPAGVAGTAEALVVDVNAWERHPQLTVPMLLVVGERDGDFAPNASAFAARFPQDLIREVRLPEAGHAANIEQPREFEAAIVGFAREIAYLREPRVENNRVLMALGGALVFAGLGLLGAAVLFNGGGGDDGSDLVAAAAEPTQTPVAQVAGTSAAGPSPTVTRQPSSLPVSTPSGATSSPTAALPAATSPAATAVPTATPVPANNPQPTPAPEPTATPTEVPTPSATATPSGPFVTLSGPASAAVGEPITVYAVTGPSGVLRTDITLPTGQVRTHSAGESWTPAAPGCYAFSVIAYFSGGTTVMGFHSVSVGGVSCNGGQG